MKPQAANTESGAIKLTLGSWESLKPHASRVRQTVFVREQGIPIELEWDEWDDRSLHCVAYDGDTPVATGRLLPDGHIGRMAVLKSYRSAKLGGRVLQALIEAGRQRGHTSFELSAQQYVSSFYRRHGFVQIGEPYLEVGIPHVRMRLDDSLPRQYPVVERVWDSPRPDGGHLFQREWLPGDIKPAGCVYLLHGLGEHGGRYGGLARQMAGCGWQVRMHDHRGHGRSSGRRGVISRPEELLDDALAMVEAYREQCDQKPVLMGHSLGGALAAQFAVRHQSILRALVLSSPALALSVALPTRLQIRLMNRLAPDLAVSNGLDASKLSHDPAAVLAYRNDPMVHDRVSGRLMRWLMAAGEEARASAQSLAIPVLMLVAGADEIVDPAGSREFVERAKVAQVAFKWYPGAYHELFHEQADTLKQAVDDLRQWLTALPQ